MRHYEVVLMIHPDQSEQVPAMLERYRTMIEKDGGAIHRLEDWGRRQLSYPIKKVHKAHYVLLNIQVSKDVMGALKDAFRYNDAVLRHLILVKEALETEMSHMLRPEEEPKFRPRESRDRDSRENSY